MTERRRKRGIAKVVPLGMDQLQGTQTWQAQEQRVAACSGGKRVSGSGASLYARGDVRTPDFLIEAKQTEKESIRITWAWLKKITQQALAAQRLPALAFEVRSQEPRDLLAESEWVAVPMSVWQQLMDKKE